MRRSRTSVLLVLLGTGCASPATRLRADQAEETGAANAQGSWSGRSPTRQGSLSTPQREHLISLARKFLGQTSIQVGRKKYPADCTGFVRALFDPLGIDLLASGRRGDSGVQAIYRYAQAHGEVYMRRAPEPGDLVFFRETYDRNRDGRQNNGLTHVGLVEAVSSDGTVSVIHRVKRGVVRYRMNLQHEDIHIDPRTRQTLNDYIKAGSGTGRGTLTGQLFAAYGAVLPPTRNVARRPEDSSARRPLPGRLLTASNESPEPDRDRQVHGHEVVRHGRQPPQSSFEQPRLPGQRQSHQAGSTPPKNLMPPERKRAETRGGG